MSERFDRLRPVQAIERRLHILEALQAEGRTGDPRRGPLRQQLYALIQCLPRAALHPGEAAALQKRLQHALGRPLELRAELTRPLPPSRGAALWASAHDAQGAVISIKLEALQEGERPFDSFFPTERSDHLAEEAADQAFEAAAHALSFLPLAPRLGWYRLQLEDTHATSFPSIEGPSLGAALALIFLSHWTDSPLPQDQIVSGCVDREGTLTLPGATPESLLIKARAISQERSWVHSFVVPSPFADELRASAIDLPLEIVGSDSLTTLAARFGLDLGAEQKMPLSVDAWLAAVEELSWFDNRRLLAPRLRRARAERLERVWPALCEQAGFADHAPWAVLQSHHALQLLLCKARLQSGALGEATAIATELSQLEEALPQEDRPDHLAATQRSNGLASLLIELGRFEEAQRYAEAALRSARDAAHPLEEARVRSTLGRVFAHAGNERGALAQLEDAIAAFLRVAPWEANIACCTRVGVLCRLGRLDDAWAALEEAEALNQSMGGQSAGWYLQNQLYLAAEGLHLALASPPAGERAVTQPGEETRARDLKALCLNARHLLVAAPAGLWPQLLLLGRLVELDLQQDVLSRSGSPGWGSAFAEDWQTLHALCEAHPGEVTRRQLERSAAACVQALGLGSTLVPKAEIPGLLVKTGKFLERCVARAQQGATKPFTPEALVPSPALSEQLRGLLAQTIY